MTGAKEREREREAANANPLTTRHPQHHNLTAADITPWNRAYTGNTHNHLTLDSNNKGTSLIHSTMIPPRPYTPGTTQRKREDSVRTWETKID